MYDRHVGRRQKTGAMARRAIGGQQEASKASMLEFAEVSKSFWTGERRKVILDRASFTVDLGYSLGILAPNGTGKTTLIRMMAGLELPDEGQIYRNCRISFPLGFMGGVIGKLSAHRERPLHRAALRARSRLRGGVLPLALRSGRIFRPCRSAPIPRACGRGSPSR
jgi:ABC-type histidine transport system ATPase subunit